MRPRLARRPDPIAAARGADFHLIAGRVLPLVPRGVQPTLAGRLPYDLAVDDDAVLTRVDLEEHYEQASFARPELERVERARDFYIGDGTGHALVRLTGDGGRLHPDAELHLDAPFTAASVPETAVHRSRSAFIRTLRAGQQIYLWGKARVQPDESGLTAQVGGYRDAPMIAVFSGDDGPLHLYDEVAFRSVAAWQALPWYRKLSVLVRNR